VLVKRKANILTSSLAPNEESLVVGGADNLLCLYSLLLDDGGDAGLAEKLWETDLGSHVCGAVYNRSGNCLVTVCENDQIRIVQAHSGKVTSMLAGRGNGFSFVGGSRWGGYSMDFTDMLMAVTGGGADFKKVRLWSLPNFSVYENLCYTSNVYCCQFSPDYQTLAVGLDGGTLHMHKMDELNAPSLRLVVGEDHGSVRTIRFSPDGRLMVCGQYNPGDYSVYMAASAHKIGQFRIQESGGIALCFSPKGDKFAVGGGAFQAVTFRRSPAHPAAPSARFEVTASIERYQQATGTHSVRSEGDTDVGEALAAAEAGVVAAPGGTQSHVHTIRYAEVTTNFVVLASGSYLVVLRRSDGATISVMDVGAAIAGNNGTNRAICVTPDEKLVVLVIKTSRVEVRSFPSGDVRHRVGPFDSRVFGCCVSTDGFLFFAHGDFGVEVFDSSDGQSAGNFDEEVQICAVSTFCGSGKRLLATVGAHNSLMIYGLGNGGRIQTDNIVHRLQQDHPTLGVCFDRTGSRVVFSSQTQTHVASVETGALLQTFGPPAMASTRLDFSPVDEDLVIQGSGMGRGVARFGRKLRVLSISSGAETPYSAMLHASVDLPNGHIQAPTVGCVASLGKEPSLMVHAAETSSLVQFDLATFSTAIADGSFTAAQLIAMSARRPETIADFARQFPDAVNVQRTDGNTVLHALAETDKNFEVDKWLFETAAYTPIANNEGVTALNIAISRYNVGLCQSLVNNLSATLNAVSARLLTDDIRSLATTMPRLLLPCLQAMERGPAFQLLSTFRADLDRTEVRGMDRLHTASLLAREKAEPTLWHHLESSSTTKGNGVKVLCKVLVMTDFIGNPNVSPFHIITRECDATAFKSKLMEMAVEFKWNVNVARLVRAHLLWHIFVVALASTVMVAATQAHLGRGFLSSVFVDLTQAVLAVVVIVDLSLNHALKLWRVGGAIYWMSLWNKLDLVSGLALLVAGGCHFFTDAMELQSAIQSAGALGVASKWIGLLDYFRSGRRTGPLVLMVVVIANDMAPFLGVLAVTAIGATFFFVIDLPGSTNYRSVHWPNRAWTCLLFLVDP
jgi:WD40 repeat protein